MSEEKTPEKHEATEHSETTEEHQPPIAPLRDRIAASDPRTVLVPTMPVDWYAREQAYQDRQVALIERQIVAAEKLNCITVWAAIVGAIGLLILAGTLWATKTAADAAKASAEAELTSVRGWLVPYDIDIPPLTALNKGTPFEIDFQNDGKTIALEACAAPGNPTGP